jgi:dolichyl-phosphate-mannose-protein mannosyltransferase
MNSQAPAQPYLWREIVLVVVVTLVAAALRFWEWRSIGITHFDEGIYALAGLWAVNGGGLLALDPGIIPYAPPGLPVLIGLSYSLFGDSDHAAILVAQLLGVATIPLIAWLARRAFGSGAGAAAAALAALAGVHIVFSRMALTDGPFLFMWVLALIAGIRFLERPGPARALLLGGAVGLAQYFKYNGCLTGVVVALAALRGVSLKTPAARRDSARTLVWLIAAGGVAALVYTPWYLFVEAQEGGYAGLLKHHSGYLKDITAWPENWRLQLGQAVALSGGSGWGIAAWALAWSGMGFARNGLRIAPRESGCRPRFWIGLLAGCALLGKIPNLTWWVSLGCMPWALFDRRPSIRVVAASWALLTVLTPFYHPYARLWLPVHAAGWLFLGGLIERIWSRFLDVPRTLADVSIEKRDRRLVVEIVVTVTCAGLGACQVFFARTEATPLGRVLQPTNGLRIDIQRIERAIPAGARTLKLLTRPPTLFYLRNARTYKLQRLESSTALFSVEPDSFALVEQVQLAQEGDYGRRFNSLAERWDKFSAFVVDMEPVDLLDHDPAAAFGGRYEFEQEVIWVLRPKGRGSQ